jgi:hypothetical protein
MPVIRHSGFLGSLIAGCVALSGCVYADGPYNEPSQERLKLESRSPQAYTVQVANKVDIPVSADGRIILNVPRFQRAHKTYLFGVAKVRDSSPEDTPAISLKKEGRTVRKFSLNDLKKLPMDSDGYRLIRVE